MLVISGCAAQTTTVTPVTPTKPVLTPYIFPTATRAPATLGTPRPTRTAAPTSTPTPFTYTIAKDDTMLGIALKFGVSLEELQAANPTANPRMLSVGQQLVIPLGGATPQVFTTPTALPVTVAQPTCYPVAGDGAWCFALVQNTLARSVENLTAQLQLFDSAGEVVAEGIATTPLNVLQSGEALPFMYFFSGGIPNQVIPQIELLSALPVEKNDPRYLNAWLDDLQTEIAANGLTARVNGQLGLPKKSEPASQIWLVAVAYDAQGNVVGVRRQDQGLPLAAGSSRDFAIEVYSLAQPISRVDIQVEARPSDENQDQNPAP
jgi:LysM repeat protein